jgi:hypothetical protein
MRRVRDIGGELLSARAAGVRWKMLSRRYKLSRSALYRMWRDAARRAAQSAPAGACPHCGHLLVPRDPASAAPSAASCGVV